jgi:hypothetical protein
MLFAKGMRPTPDAGDMSPLTEMLRPPIGLTPEQCARARRLRRRQKEIAEIAVRIGATEDQTRQALATMRTRKLQATRRALNVTIAAHRFVVGEALKGEPCWETVDRLLGELAIRRAMVGVASSSPD